MHQWHAVMLPSGEARAAQLLVTFQPHHLQLQSLLCKVDLKFLEFFHHRVVDESRPGRSTVTFERWTYPRCSNCRRNGIQW